MVSEKLRATLPAQYPLFKKPDGLAALLGNLQQFDYQIFASFSIPQSLELATMPRNRKTLPYPNVFTGVAKVIS